MFDFESAIVDWRRQMLAAGIDSPEHMEELEMHLRDDVEQQMLSGSNARQAFEAAVQRLGHAEMLHGEFKKDCGMKRGAMLRCGSFGLVLTILLNFAGLHVFHRHSSVFFSDPWWSGWFPNYLAWTSFTIIGWAANRKSPPKMARP